MRLREMQTRNLSRAWHRSCHAACHLHHHSNVCDGFAGSPISATVLLAFQFLQWFCWHSNCCNGFAGISISAMVLLASDLASKTTRDYFVFWAADIEQGKFDHDLLGFQPKFGVFDSICCGKVQHMKVMLGRLKHCGMCFM